jgi:hypothetical protein
MEILKYSIAQTMMKYATVELQHYTVKLLEVQEVILINGKNLLKETG